MDSRIWKSMASLLVLIFIHAAARGGDWPTWRYDAQRSAVTEEALPAELHLQWQRAYPPLEPAWPLDSARPEDPEMLLFDPAYEPIVAGKNLYVASSANDRLTALDAATGLEKWRFYADGPIRLAPAVWADKVYFVSDDGYLYCLDAEKGTLLWKFRGALGEQLVVGNGRLISAWPARGGPVVAEGKVYFAAGIFPFLKTAVYALDAQTGQLAWKNDACDWLAPQGYLTVVDGKLWVPNSHSGISAEFDLQSGKLVAPTRFQHPKGVNPPQGGTGGVWLTAGGGFRYAGGYIRGGTLGVGRLKAGGDYDKFDNYQGGGSLPILTSHAVYCFNPRQGLLTAYDAKNPTYKEVVDKRGEKQKAGTLSERWNLSVPASQPSSGLTLNPGRLHLQAGSRLLLSHGETLLLVDLPQGAGQPRIAWQTTLSSPVWSAVAANGKLFVTTLDGRLTCFGAKPTTAAIHAQSASKAAAMTDQWSQTASRVLEQFPGREGYCMVWGIGSGRLVEELARQSPLPIVAVDPDKKKVESLRRRLDQEGLYGSRVAVVAATPSRCAWPPYLASIVTTEDWSAAGCPDGEVLRKLFVRKLFQVLRPYGGVACLAMTAKESELLARSVQAAKLDSAEWKAGESMARLRRSGPPAGSDIWSHQYANASNTSCSRDQIQSPKDVLWFATRLTEGIITGGGENDAGAAGGNVGPAPRVAGGRLFMEGPGMLRAADLYTGRILWSVELPRISRWVGGYPSIIRKSNYVALADALYVADQDRCVRLDPATGKTTAEFKLPAKAGSKANAAHLLVSDNVLLVAYTEQIGKEILPADSSKRILAMDRQTGKTLWSQEAAASFIHTGIAIGDGRVFSIDRPTDQQIETLKRKGAVPQEQAQIRAWDLRTGAVLWKGERDLAASWLAYSQEHDLLIAAGGGRTVAYRAKTGQLLWDKPIPGGSDRPLVLYQDVVVNQGSNRGTPPAQGFDLRSGEPAKWQCPRGKCASGVGSDHLFVFRDGYATYYDLATGQRVSLTGIKAGCSAPGIPADGVLCLPLYSRHCTCRFQLKTSVALVSPPKPNFSIIYSLTYSWCNG